MKITTSPVGPSSQYPDKFSPTISAPSDNFTLPINEAGDTIISLDVRSRQLDQTLIEHGTNAYLSANYAISTMNTEVDKVQSNLNAIRPDLKDTKWDFVMKDGKFQVSGDGLGKKDAKYIEASLNADKTLVSAANSFSSAAVMNLETSKENPSSNYLNAYTGHMENRTFYKVADQMNGTVNFRALLENTKQFRAIGQSGSKADDVNNLKLMGGAALDVLSSQLKSSNHKIDMDGFTFDPVEGTIGRS